MLVTFPAVLMFLLSPVPQKQFRRFELPGEGSEAGHELRYG